MYILVSSYIAHVSYHMIARSLPNTNNNSLFNNISYDVKSCGYYVPSFGLRRLWPILHHIPSIYEKVPALSTINE